MVYNAVDDVARVFHSTPPLHRGRSHANVPLSASTAANNGEYVFVTEGVTSTFAIEYYIVKNREGT